MWTISLHVLVGRMAWWDGTPLAQSEYWAPLLTLQCVVKHNKVKERYILPYFCVLCRWWEIIKQTIWAKYLYILEIQLSIFCLSFFAVEFYFRKTYNYIGVTITIILHILFILHITHYGEGGKWNCLIFENLQSIISDSKHCPYTKLSEVFHFLVHSFPNFPIFFIYCLK